jgi:hypothetical protein
MCRLMLEQYYNECFFSTRLKNLWILMTWWWYIKENCSLLFGLIAELIPNRSTKQKQLILPLQPGDKNQNSFLENTEEFYYEYLRSSPELRFLSAENPVSKGHNVNKVESEYISIWILNLIDNVVYFVSALYSSIFFSDFSSKFGSNGIMMDKN